MFQRSLAVVFRSRPHRRYISSTYYSLSVSHIKEQVPILLHPSTTSTTRHRKRRRVVTHRPHLSSAPASSSSSPHIHTHHHHTSQPPIPKISLHTSPTHPLSAMSTDPASTPNQVIQTGDASTDGIPAASLPNQQHSGKDLKDRYIGSIDQGTTSSRFIIFNGVGNEIVTHQEEFTQLHPHSG